MRILSYYLRLACEKAGVNWHRDNDAELAAIDDEITALAVAANAEEIRRLHARISALESFVGAPQP